MQHEELMNMILPYKDKLFRFVLRLVNDTFDAEEILQDLMVKIWKKKDQFVTIENKEAWCMTVVRNLAYDKLRKRKQRTQDIEEQYDLRDKAVAPDVALEQKDALRKVKEVIAQLPKDLRTVIQLRDIEQYSYQEIADITGWTLGKVKINLHRARKTLQHSLMKIEL